MINRPSLGKNSSLSSASLRGSLVTEAGFRVDKFILLLERFTFSDQTTADNSPEWSERGHSECIFI